MAAAGLALEYTSPFDILNRDKTRLAIPDNDGLESAGMKFPLPSVADVSRFRDWLKDQWVMWYDFLR